MKIIMTIFYKEKIYRIDENKKIYTEGFMFIVMHHFATVNLNTFVCAEARRIAYE